MSSPKEILGRHGLRPKKDWGQNFLGDEQILGKIAAACSVGPGDRLVELGAGLGHLTRQLAATGAQITAVERDRDLVKVLEEELRLPNVRLVAANAAALDFLETAGGPNGPKPVIAGNLPYHLSSSILFEVLDQRDRIRRAVFLLQKEVAERIAAEPGGRDYGLLSVLLQAFASVQVMFDVRAGAFHPPPKVDSAVVRIDILEKPRADVADSAHFVRVVKAAFAQRRKTLLNTLKAARDFGDADQILAALGRAGIDPQVRAETLAPEAFARIAKELPAKPKPS